MLFLFQVGLTHLTFLPTSNNNASQKELLIARKYIFKHLYLVTIPRIKKSVLFVNKRVY